MTGCTTVGAKKLFVGMKPFVEMKPFAKMKPLEINWQSRINWHQLDEMVPHFANCETNSPCGLDILIPNLVAFA